MCPRFVQLKSYGFPDLQLGLLSSRQHFVIELFVVVVLKRRQYLLTGKKKPVEQFLTVKMVIESTFMSC